MNRLVIMMCLFLIFIMPQAWGGYTPKYPDPYRQTLWNNMTDAWHTVGQSPAQAKFTKMRLRNARAKTRVNSINQANRQAWQHRHFKNPNNI
jgi:hypothetical protein